MIGEKINPTGRKKLAEALQAHHYDYVRDLALKQVEFGADVLDVKLRVEHSPRVFARRTLDSAYFRTRACSMLHIFPYTLNPGRYYCLDQARRTR